MSTTATAPNDVYDSWNEAENAKPRPKVFFGHCAARSQPVVLQKGSPAQPFNLNLHRTEDRRTQVVISIQPLPGSRYMDPIERNMLVESNEWAKIVLPSIHDIGIKPRDINGLYVQAEMIPVRDYIKKDGTPGQATVPKFIAIYPSEQLCRDAQEALYGKQEPTSDYSGPAAPSTATPSAPATTPNAGMTEAAQDALLAALWKASGENEDQMGKLLAATPSFRHFTTQSPEVQRAMSF